MTGSRQRSYGYGRRGRGRPLVLREPQDERRRAGRVTLRQAQGERIASSLAPNVRVMVS